MTTRKNKKIINKKLKKTSQHRLIPVFLFGAGLFLIGVGLIRQYLGEVVLRLGIDVTAHQIQTSSGIPSRVRAGYLFDLPVEAGEIVKGKWTVSDTVATYLTSSSRLGNKGNVIIYGHNRKKILANLRKVKMGDIVLVTDEQGINWRYQVAVVKAVKPVDVSWLQETAEPVLTMYTCTGFMDSQRLIVQARLLGIEKGL